MFLDFDFLFIVLGLELRAVCMLGIYSTAELHTTSVPVSSVLCVGFESGSYSSSV